jgi:hypothetical protein
VVSSVNAPTAVACLQHGKIPRPPNYLDHVNVIFFISSEDRLYNQFITMLNVILLHRPPSCLVAEVRLHAHPDLVILRRNCLVLQMKTLV